MFSMKNSTKPMTTPHNVFVKKELMNSAFARSNQYKKNCMKNIIAKLELVKVVVTRI